MPTGKRASMREGPLAALFRKTAEDTGQPGAEAPAEEPRAEQREQPAAPAAPEPTAQSAPTSPK